MAYTLDLRKNKKEPVAQPEAPRPSEPAPLATPVQMAIPTSSAPGISWQGIIGSAPDKRHAQWVGVVLLGAAGALAFLWQDFLFSLVLVLGAAAFVASAYRSAEPAHMRVDVGGVTVNGRRYPFTQIKSFWIAYEPDQTKDLIIAFKRAYQPVLRLPLGDADPLEIRKIMVSLVPETEHEDSLIDQVVQKLVR